jgi:Domain of unknown function (DUF4160)
MAEIAISIEGDLLDDLTTEFYLVESVQRNEPNRRRGSIVATFTVQRVNGLLVEIRAKEHPPPHFHVSYKGKDASFSIIDCSRLSGVAGLERFDSAIRNWWERNKSMLIEKWNNSRPTDCPVGPIRTP